MSFKWVACWSRWLMVLVERQQQQPFPLLTLTMSFSTFSAKIGPSSSFPVSFRVIRSRSKETGHGSTVSEDRSLPYVLYASSACSDTYIYYNHRHGR